MFTFRNYPLDGTPQTSGKNYFVCGYCENIGETVRLDEAIRLAEANRDISDIRIVEYATKTAFYL